MLNAETKRRINACRDILVGKVTDPKAQVEQITIALMYKFMNDMDHEAQDLSGSPQFFAGDFASYSWDRITDARLAGDERIRLYAEGIEAVVKNPGMPELFRQIFRNAYLPYRDPETFNLFSQEISGFHYEHSEDLGDAFEYLLSVMQSQGDAGQFRTPRHIIDFMVEVVKPQPSEAILDPACGTGGFLVSAYKHIVKHHPTLSPAQVEELHHNVEGYDISPDMVRLSRVNLYLHQFADPRIFEYDTLTSEDKWGHRTDVILANPPFMTPKGGIRPHRKFSLESNRSEVLFVDYIAEHLMVGGRAAVIVPEGIIFQSGKAYQQLRRMLVENSLWAVASLPAGVFNPYSGVKTSVLFLDRALAEKGGPVLFAQIKADGHDLGAQRKVVTANDLPIALKLLDDAHHRLETGQVPGDFRDSLAEHPALTHLFVPRAVLLAEGDCNLSGERYRVVAAAGPRKWPMVKLGSVCELFGGGTPSRETETFWANGSIKWISSKHISDGGRVTGHELITERALAESSSKVAPKGSSILITRVSVGKSAYCDDNYAINQDLTCARSTTVALSPEFLFLLCQTVAVKIEENAQGVGVRGVTRSFLAEFEIPLPPLSVQQEIVAEVARYQTVIDGARQVVENWKPSFTVDPDWPVVKLGELCTIVRGSSPRPAGDPRYYGGSIPRLMVADLTRDGMRVTPMIDHLTDEGAELSRPMKSGDLVMAVSGQPGLCAILQIDCVIHDGFVGFRDWQTERVLVEFGYLFLSANRELHNDQSTGAIFQNLKSDQIREFDFPIPPIPIQQAIVDRIEAERALVESNKQLIELMKTRIEETMQRVWN